MSKKSFAPVPSGKHPLRFAASLILAGALSFTAPAVAFADEENEAEPAARIARVQDKGPVALGMFQAASLMQSCISTCSQDLHDGQAAELERRDQVAAGQAYLESLTDRALKALTAHQIAALGGTSNGETIDDDATPQAAAPSGTLNLGEKPADAPAMEQPVNEADQVSDKLYNVIYYNGEFVPFVQGTSDDTTAPRDTASTWFGNGSVTDSDHSYFIGHNPGVFTGVMDLQIGDEIVVWDYAGNSRSYYVYDAIIIPNASNYYVFQNRLTPTGESITLQTCCGDDVTVRCVMAR